MVAVDIGSGSERAEWAMPVCCVGAYEIVAPMARSTILHWHSGHLADNHRRDVDYARREVDTANTPAS